jgi:hypothetical protein
MRRNIRDRGSEAVQRRDAENYYIHYNASDQIKLKINRTFLLRGSNACVVALFSSASPI